MAEQDETTKVETIWTDPTGADNPFNSGGYIGVDPYFQTSVVIDSGENVVHAPEAQASQTTPAVVAPPK